MEITWYGLSCFKLAEKGSATVLTDPFDLNNDGRQSLKLSADIVTLSRKVPEFNLKGAVQGSPYVITGPGEYEVGNVFITGIQTNWNNTQGPAWNTLYVFDFDSLTVAHLGNLKHVPTQAEIESMGAIKIALVPVGSGYGLSAAKAAEVVSLLEPNIVIPMYLAGEEGDALSKFLKEMGTSEADRLPSMKISNTALPEETKVIVLEHQHGIKLV